MPLRRSRSLSALAPAALLAALGSGPRDEAAFHPGKHLILTKAFAEDLSLEMDSFDLTIDGNPVEQDVPVIRLASARRATFADEYREAGEGRIGKLERTLERLSGEVVVAIEDEQAEEHTATLESELADAVVLFEWDDEQEDYRRSFEEGGTGEDAHLAALEPEADFLAFLPGEPVEVDASWEVEASALSRVFAPGGDLRLLPSSLGDEPYVEMQPPAMLGACVTSLADVGGTWEGTVKATYAGAEVRGGVRVGRITLEVDATASADLEQRYARALESLGQDFEFTFTGMELAWTLDGRGELLWDLEAGHVHAFTLDGEVELEAKLAWNEAMQGQELALEGHYRLSGTSRSSMALEP